MKAEIVQLICIYHISKYTKNNVVHNGINNQRSISLILFMICSVFSF
nr:MAG TPA: hypothetical protein [Caudoviricetes sp.]